MKACVIHKNASAEHFKSKSTIDSSSNKPSERKAVVKSGKTKSEVTFLAKTKELVKVFAYVEQNIFSSSNIVRPRVFS